jgi:hypothetical protein
VKELGGNNHMRQATNWKKYAATFAITLAIFLTALYASNYFNSKRIQEIRAIEQRVSIDILSTETQFDLLEELSCQDIEKNPIISSELNSLARRLAYAEEQLGIDNPEVVSLKRSYTILQIKDYLLMKRILSECDEISPVVILYFYSNAGDCPDCEREGYVLTYLRENYPQLRVYAFDYHLDLPALQTLITINDVKPEFPALLMEGTPHYGFQSRENIEEFLPELALEKATTTEEIQ